MSRIGKKPITIPAGVTVSFADRIVTVKGPKGELKRTVHPLVSVTIEGDIVTVSVAKPDNKQERSLWGTFGSHITNMIAGVITPYEKKLELNGVGFRVNIQGQKLNFELGFSHPVSYTLPAVVTGTVEKNLITLQSVDVEALGQTAAEIRALKKPEPYKGKGIKYLDEVIRRKAGKAASK
jgi:large subunit ribosomal protein L6